MDAGSLGGSAARSVSVVSTTSDFETTDGSPLTLLPLQLKATDRASSLSVPINLGALHSLIWAEHMVPVHTGGVGVISLVVGRKRNI